MASPTGGWSAARRGASDSYGAGTLGDVVAAVDGQLGAGDEARGVRGQEEHRPDEVGGVAEARRRRLALDLDADLAAERVARHRGLDPARQDRVDPDPGRAELDRQRPGQPEDPGLGRAV